MRQILAREHIAHDFCYMYHAHDHHAHMPSICRNFTCLVAARLRTLHTKCLREESRAERGVGEGGAYGLKGGGGALLTDMTW